MSYSASNIIKITTRLRASGLGLANFASVTVFATPSEVPADFAPDTRRVFQDLNELSLAFGSDTETYAAAERYLGTIPRPRQIIVYAPDPSDKSITDTLNKARNQYWWYVTLLTASKLADVATVLATAQWCESNESFFVNNQTGDAVEKIRDINVTDDISSQLTQKGYRHTATFGHADDGNAGNALIAHFTAVNYGGMNTTITGFGKKSPGVEAESLNTTQYTASTQKKCAFYTEVDLQGSRDMGRWMNTTTHSTYGEQIDDVINLDAFINHINVTLYNTIVNQTTKLPQTVIGQAILIGALTVACQRYVDNGYLGERTYTDPDTGLEEYTNGFKILTVPEAILTLTNEERDARLAAPLRLRVFRAGAIESAYVDIEIF